MSMMKAGSVALGSATEEYFGAYGGFFVPDPFTPALDGLAAAYEDVARGSEFSSLFDRALRGQEVGPLPLGAGYELAGATVYPVASQALNAAVAGYCALAKALDRTVAAGVETHDQVRALVAASRALGVELALWLNRALASDPGLVEDLEQGGVEVDTEKCAKLFDIPEMYAFQRYITNPVRNLFAALKTNVGPYPYPSMTAQFAAVFGEAAWGAAEAGLGSPPDVFLAPGFPGTSALGILRAKPDGALRVATYEVPFDAERGECYCGAYTRVAEVGDDENVLSPELLAAWEAGEVERIQASDVESAVRQLAVSGAVVVVEEG